MAGFKVVKTEHTGITVSNLERSVRMFRDVLGFQVLSQESEPGHADHVRTLSNLKNAPVKLAFVKAPGGHVLELIEYHGPKSKSKVKARPCDTGYLHLALGVDNLTAAIKAADKAGLKVMNEVVRVKEGAAKGAKAAYLRDRDGIIVEMIQRPK
jgi:catechol 2,3-dioxygenase-like lactoylglutathione lyase family enzyme